MWVDDPHFNLRYHVRHSALPAPGLRRAAAQRSPGGCSPSALDRNKPLWEINLVEGLEPGPTAALRDHREDPPRARRRGLAASTSPRSLFDAAPDGSPPPAAAGAWVPRPEPTDAAAAGRRAARARDGARPRPCAALRALTRAPRQVARARPASGSWASARWRGPGSARRRPRRSTCRSARTGATRGSTREVARFKAIKNALGGTLNDVVLAAVTLALGRFLRRRGDRDRRARAQGDGPGLGARRRRARRAGQPRRGDVGAAARLAWTTRARCSRASSRRDARD